MGQGPTKYEPLTQREKDVIKDSWARLRGKISKCGLQVFTLLLDAHPELGSLFEFREEEEKLENHGLKVLREFSIIINNLDSNPQVFYILQQNARSHQQFKIKAATYDHLRDAFLKMLEAQLGTDKKFNEIHSAWNRGLGVMFVIIVDLTPRMSLPSYASS